MLKQLPGTPSRVALVVPDSAAKVSLMTFEQIPARAADLDQLVRWQARKTAPFRVEDAQVAYSPGLPTDDGGRELIVSLMRRDIVEEYEAVCASGGGHAGVVDLASFSVVNAVLAGGGVAEADWLLVHVAHGYSTIAIVRRGRLILFRNRPAEGDGNLADLVHQTTMYYEDRLRGGGFERVFLAVRRGGHRGSGCRHSAPIARTASGHRGRGDRPRRVGGEWAGHRWRAARSDGRAPWSAVARAAGGRNRGIMLRSNLATRPFYNERAVYLVLGLVAVVGLVVLYVEAGRIIQLSQLNTERIRQAEDDEREGAALSVLAAELQRSVSPEALDEVAAAAREANLLIDQRVFSWTDFFNRIETTLPPDVMLTEVRPDIEPGSIEVTMGVLGQSLGAINEFIGALEDSGAFTEVLNRSSEITEDGMYRAVLRGTYLQTMQSDVDQSALSAEPPTDAEAESADPDTELVDENRLPEGDDEPPADAGDPESDGAAVDDRPDLEPEPTPALPGRDLS